MKRLTPAELGVSADSVVQMSRVYLPQKSKQTQLLEGSAPEAAARLVEKLKFEVRVL